MLSQQPCTSGTAVHGQTFEYGPNWQKVMPQNQTVYTDLLGRNFKTEYADGTYAMNYYNLNLSRALLPEESLRSTLMTILVLCNEFSEKSQRVPVRGGY